MTQISQLLHDAEHAEAGAEFARMVKDEPAAKELIAKRNRLLAQAKRLDPKRYDAAWGQTTLAVR